MTVSRSGVGEELARLYKRTSSGIIPGLDTIARLMHQLGDPHRAVPVIHIAGTNGKGSVCAMIESMLRAAGLRTGLYTSPHLVRFNERIQINGQSISDETLAALITAVEAADAQQQKSGSYRAATFFECSTALAFKHFADAGVDVAVIETGLGGIWDATNVVQPAVSVITPVSMDHMEFLGNKISSVAREKAGIIKPGIPVVAAAQVPEVAEIMTDTARRQQSTLIWADQAVSVQCTKRDLSGQRLTLESSAAGYGSVQLPLLGRHQVENAALALAAVEIFAQALQTEFDPKAIKLGLAQVTWPGRLQVAETDPLLILDGAHNPAGAQTLKRALEEWGGGKPVALVFSLLRDKGADEILSIWKSLVHAAWAVPMDKHRALSETELLAVMAEAGLEPRSTSLETALTEARAWAVENDGCICVTGSLYLVGEYFALMECSPR